LFTPKELAMYRNVNCWQLATVDEEWIDLPGPAALWPDDYDLESFGFGLPPLEKAPLYLRAWEIATMVDEEPADFALLLPSNEELVMMDLGAAAMHPRKFFY
jgi:hypothetical protein